MIATVQLSFAFGTVVLEPSPASPQAEPPVVRPPPPPPPAGEAVDFIRHPRARRYVIRVRKNGSVRVTVPRGGSKREARAFVERERAWIERERGRVAEAQAEPPDAADAALAAGAGATVAELRGRARRELPPRLLELAERHGLRVTRVSVRNQRWRWGSCSRSGHICLNWRLVAMPPEVRDYVMVHELMHLRRLDHSARFWTLVAQACPDYQAARRWLRDPARRVGSGHAPKPEGTRVDEGSRLRALGPITRVTP